MRLDRRLCELAFGTRKEVQALIRQGLVTVGGQTVRDPGQHTDDAAVIMVKGTGCQAADGHGSSAAGLWNAFLHAGGPPRPGYDRTSVLYVGR